MEEATKKLYLFSSLQPFWLLELALAHMSCCRGFKGPVPPPLLIRSMFIQYSFNSFTLTRETACVNRGVRNSTHMPWFHITELGKTQNYLMFDKRFTCE